MARGISATITNALDSTTVSGIFYLVRITMENQTLYYAERGGITYDGQLYEARVTGISSLDFSPTSENKASITLANVDGAITTLDQTTGFAGCKVEIIEYVNSVSDGYVKFSGIADELSSISQKTATLDVYGGSSTVSTEIPKRVISINCNWEFANTSNYVNSRDFEGSECPYNRVSTIGFRATIDPSSSIDGSSDPVTFVIVWDATSYANGAKFLSADQCIIGSERLLITAATAPNGSRQQTITATRAFNATTIAAHSTGATVYFGSCPFSVAACKARGMYGNNPNDQASSVNRNYFGGVPQITEKTTNGTAPLVQVVMAKKGLVFSGNDSAYNTPLPLVYGKVRIKDPKPILVKSEQDFLSVVCLVAEGPLATNASNDLQTTTADAYSTDSLGTIIEINGARRHDPRPGYGIQCQNGTMDQPTIIPNFINSLTDFTTYKLGYNGTAYFALRIDTKNHPSVDVKAGDVNALAQIEYGRVVRVYTTDTVYTRKATKNPAWVMLDMLTSKRGGGGFDYSECNIQSFLDVADYCSEAVTSVFDATSVARWTFNGAIDSKKSLSEWMALVSLGCYTTPPFRDADNKWKIKALKQEASLASVPFFSSNSAVTAERNILWNDSGSTLTKSRRPFAEIPNEIRVSYIDSTDFAKVTLVIADREAQRKIGRVLGNNSITVLSRSVDLPGTSTLDEAARIGTLILRAGSFGEGGLSNNLKVNFQSSYRTAADVEVGDVIEVNDDLLDETDERYFRITDIKDSEIQVQNGGILFTRSIEAVLHANEIYDDTAITVTTFSRVSPPVASNQEPPEVTGYSITEVGIFDSNGKPTTRLTINYTEPSPLDNYRSLMILRSSDDGVGNAVGDWRIIGEVFYSGSQIQYEVSGTYQHFAAVSRPLSGHLPSVDTKDSAGNNKYPRVRILVDGKADSALSAPTGLAAFGRLNNIYLTWTAYTGTSKQLFKRFNIYRGTTSNPAASAIIGETDTNWFTDASDTIKNNPAVTYYYFLKGVSILENVTIDGVTLDGLSSFSSEAHDNPGTDAGVPTAPTLAVIQMASANPAESTLTIGIEKPGGASNWDTIESTRLQITTDITFATFPNNNCLNRDFSRPPLVYTHKLNSPGTYYIRARVTNIYGDSLWSGTTTIVTDLRETLSGDTGLAAAPTVTIKNNSTDANIAGNSYKITWNIPSSNTQSMWGRNILLHNSSTLPTTTTQDTGTAGVLVAGTNRFTDATKAWTPSQWVSPDAHNVIIFSPYRSGSPSWDLEGMWIWGNISGNGATYLDIDIGGQKIPYTGTGLKYYIVKQGVGHHVAEKVKFASLNEVDPGLYGTLTPSQARTKSISISQTGLYAFVSLNTLYSGAGIIGVSSVSSFNGLVASELGTSSVTTAKIDALAVTRAKVAALAISETEIDDDSISTPKLQALSVTATEIFVSYLSAINQDAGTITAGTVTGATIRTAASGTRIELDSTNGLRSYAGSTLVTQLPISGGYAGGVLTNTIAGLVDAVYLSDNGGNNTAVVSSAGFSVTIGASTAFDILGANIRFKIGGSLRQVSTFNDGTHDVLYLI